MEYKETYDYFYKKAYLLTKQSLRKKLIQSRLESKVFYIVRNEINEFRNKIISKKSNLKLYCELNELNTLFCNSIHNYNQNNIELALRNEVHPMYLKLNDSEKPSCYTFKKFVSDLAMFQGHCDVITEFRNQIGFYQEKYDQNDLEDLRIPQPENKSIENSAIIEKTQKQFSTKLNHLSVQTEIETDPVSSSINRLTKEEKSFLFYIMCKALSEPKEIQTSEGFNLPLTELIRLNTIIDFKDKFCFQEKFRDSNNYKMLAKGIEYFSNTERIAFLNTLIEKTTNLKLTKTMRFIKEMRNNEHNKKI
jgi:hypothetical protein